MSHFFSSRQLAQRWNKPLEFIYQNQERLEIPRIQIGREFRYPVDQIEAWEFAQMNGTVRVTERAPIARLPKAMGKGVSKWLNELVWQIQVAKRDAFSITAASKNGSSFLRCTVVAAADEARLTVSTSDVHNEIFSTLHFERLDEFKLARSLAVGSVADTVWSLLVAHEKTSPETVFSFGTDPIDLQAALSAGADFSSNKELMITFEA